MTTTKSLVFDLGEHWIIDLSCYEADGSTVLNLTGGSVRFRVGSPTALVLDYGQSSVTLTNAAQGKATIVVPPSAQTGVAPGNYSYVAQAILQDGTVSDQAIGALVARQTPAHQFP